VQSQLNSMQSQIQSLMSVFSNMQGQPQTEYHVKAVR